MNVIITSTLNRNCGVGQYTERLAMQLLPKLAGLKVFRKDDHDDQLFFTYPYRSFRSLQHHVAPFYLKKAIKNMDADVWHADYLGAYYGMELARVRQPKVVTVHDAIPFFYPGSKLDFQVYKYQLKQAIKHAKFLIVVSETAKKDLVKQAGIDPEKIVAIPNGLPHEDFSTHPKKNDVFTIRYLGGLGAPHKNVRLLLHMARLLEDKGADFSLEIGGYVPEQFFLKDLAKTLELKSVHFTGFVPDEEKSTFLGGANLFVYPSLMEGFGFPPMEAMASGTAVLSTNIPVFQELLGESAHLVAPTPEAFAKEIRTLMESPALREDLTARGMEKVKEYTWEKAANKTLEVYEKAMA